MEEIGASREAEILSDKQRLEACDLLCFVYDTSDVNSFGYVASLRVGIIICIRKIYLDP